MSGLRQVSLFLTKQATKNLLRGLIDSQKENEPFSKTSIKIFNALCGANASHIVKTINPEYPKDTRHIIVDGESFSWRRAIDGNDDLQELKRTMRSLVNEKDRGFLGANDQECAYCGTTTNLTRDHDGVSFDAIANSFIRDHSPIDRVKKPNGVGYKFADAALEKLWIAYHDQMRSYQVLCRSCNAKKGNRPLTQAPTTLHINRSQP